MLANNEMNVFLLEELTSLCSWQSKECTSTVLDSMLLLKGACLLVRLE